LNLRVQDRPTSSHVWELCSQLKTRPLFKLVSPYRPTWVEFSFSFPLLFIFYFYKKRKKANQNAHYANRITSLLKKDTASYSFLLLLPVSLSLSVCLSVSSNWEKWKTKITTKSHQQKNRKCNANATITRKPHHRNIFSKLKKIMSEKKRISLTSSSALFACKYLIATIFLVWISFFIYIYMF